MTGQHTLVVCRPWWRTEPRWHARPGTGPVFQMYEAADPVTPFMKDPQLSLIFQDEDFISQGAGLAPTFKIFLPSHKRFYLVVVEIHCDMPGFPTAGRSDMCEAGLVIRRRRTVVTPELLLAAQPLVAEVAQRSAQLGKIQQKAHKTRAKKLFAQSLVASGSELIDATVENVLNAHATDAEKALADAKVTLQKWAGEAGAALVIEGWVQSKKLDQIGGWVALSDETPQTIGEEIVPLYPLIPDPADTANSAQKKTVYFALLPTSSADVDKFGAPRFDDQSTYEVRCYVRRHKPECPLKDEKPDCHGPLFWSAASDRYRLASPLDLDGTSHHPVNLPLPDLNDLKNQAMKKPKTFQAARVVQPQAMNVQPGVPQPSGSLGPPPQVCSFAIPLFFMVAYFIFQIFLPIFMLIFQLWWMLALNFCVVPSLSLDLAFDLPEIPTSLGIDLTATLDAALSGASGDAQVFLQKIQARLQARFGTGDAYTKVVDPAQGGLPVGALFQMVADTFPEQHDAYSRAGELGPPAPAGAIDAGTPLVDSLIYYQPVTPA